MGTRILRGLCVRAAGGPGTAIQFVASTEGVKRGGEALLAGDWRLDNYRRNPVVLWVHDYGGRTLPIGRAVDVRIKSAALLADIVFDQEDAFARQVEDKYRRGFLNAVSVGWQDVMEGKRTWHDLMDISAVPVPADPSALTLAERRALSAEAGGDACAYLRGILDNLAPRGEEALLRGILRNLDKAGR